LHRHFLWIERTHRLKVTQVSLLVKYNKEQGWLGLHYNKSMVYVWFSLGTDFRHQSDNIPRTLQTTLL